MELFTNAGQFDGFQRRGYMSPPYKHETPRQLQNNRCKLLHKQAQGTISFVFKSGNGTRRTGMDLNFTFDDQ